MEWYHYVTSFFAGAFLVNAIPHFIYGVSGDKFPTPFAKPPGKGLSSPMINTIWGLLNIIIGCLLFKFSRIMYSHVLHILFFIGFALMSIMLSANFQKKEKE